MNLSNPIITYSTLWISVTVLVSLKLTANLLPLNADTVVLVFSNIITFVIIYYALYLNLYNYNDDRTDISYPRLQRILNFSLAVWILGSVVEIYASGGLPLIWRLSGDTARDYRNFGIYTFHGFINAFYLFSLAALFLRFLLTRNKNLLLIIIPMLFWPFIMMNRGLLTWVSIQLTGIYVIVKKRIPVNKILLFVVLFVITFGAIGDYRVGTHDHLTQVLSDTGISVFKYLPSGFLWVYVYITSPLNNVIGGIESLLPNYVPLYSISSLVPTVVREDLLDLNGKYPLSLVNESFNTCTFYGNFLADFGILGAILAVCFLQFIISMSYLSARSGNFFSVLIYAIFFQGIILSPFTDTFTSLVAIFQIFLCLLAKSLISQGSICSKTKYC